MLDTLRQILHLLRDAESLIQTVGVAGLHAIVFAETGLLVGFFLPGDSLLVTAGILAAGGKLPLGVLLVGLAIAAVAGDQTGYLIGRKAGQTLYARPDSRFFKRKHLIAAHDFYERYGGKTIVLARFVPIIRTFAPTVAGAAEMNYRRFVLFNVAGGVGWVWTMLGGGFLLGTAFPWIPKHIEVVALVIVFLSILPILWEAWRARRSALRRDSAA